MVIKIIRGEESATIECNDQLIDGSICYQNTFERQVKEVLKAFYGVQEKPQQEAKNAQ